MKSNAPGQLLGYSIQFPRALYRLLRSSPGDTVCVEVLGDVSISCSDGTVISEEDKSSISGNPLTDKSVDLWKTLSNWTEAVNNNELDIEKTKFILFCNKSGKSGIVNEFSLASNKNEAQKAIDNAKSILANIDDKHSIWSYYNITVNQNEPILSKIIEKFELEIVNGAGYEAVYNEIKRQHLPVNQIDFIMNQLSGWLLKEINEKIASKKKAIITWESFDKQFKVLFDRSHKLELIDFTLKSPPSHQVLHNQIKIRPLYLRQLEMIGVSDDDIVEAVSDYLRARVNRDKWIECEIIDEDIATDFESRLIRYWKNQKIRLEITEKQACDEERGQLLLVDCKSRNEPIRDMIPPCQTIAGTYHALADEPLLGWHPNWEKQFKNKKEE